MPLTNPLDTIATQIWALLSAKSDFIAMFPTSTTHQVRSETTLEYAPTEDTAIPAPADYPICRVVMVSAQPATEEDSSHSFLDVVYAVEVCSGQEQQTVLRKATWAIYRAMLMWRTKVRDTVTWNSVACVYDVTADSIGFTDENQARNRGTPQWIAVWSTTIRFYFATADLVAN